MEATVLSGRPDVLEQITGIVDEFAPVAREIESRHGGRELMRQVETRKTQNWRQSPNFALALVSFLIVALPAFAWAISLRAAWDYISVVTTVAVLLAITASLCIIKLLSTLRDRVWVGVMLHWAIGAGVLSAATAIVTVFVSGQLPQYDAGPAVGIVCISALVAIAYAVLAIVRNRSAARKTVADLSAIQPAVDAYLREFRPKYEMALARIDEAIATLDGTSTFAPEIGKRLKSRRDGAISALSGNRGLYRGRVPLFITKKHLGELQLLAAAEPLLGGGPYPIMSKPSKRASDREYEQRNSVS